MDKFERRRQKLLQIKDERCDGSIASLARAMGRSHSYVTRLLYDETRDGRKRIGDDMIDVIETAFHLPRGYLDRITDADESANLSGVSPIVEFHYCKVVSGMGIDALGHLQTMELPKEQQSAYVTFPQRNPNCYAVRVVGDGLRPRAKPGDSLVFDPDATPAPGDEVLITLTDGAKLFREFLYRRDSEITLGSLNAGELNMTISSQSIKAIHCLLAIVPRSQFFTVAP